MSSHKQSKKGSHLNSDLDVEEKNETATPNTSVLGIIPQDSMLNDKMGEGLVT